MLSIDTIDMVAIDSLKWHRNFILDEMIKSEDDTAFVHPNDYNHYVRLIIDFNSVLDYYGVESKGTIQRREEVKQNGI